MTGQSGTGPMTGQYNRTHDRANWPVPQKVDIILCTKGPEEDEDEQVDIKVCDRAIWIPFDDRAIDRSHDRAIDRSRENPTLYSNERAGRGEDEQVHVICDREIWIQIRWSGQLTGPMDRVIDRSRKNPTLYSERNELEEDEDEQVGRMLWPGNSGTGPMTEQLTGPMTG